MLDAGLIRELAKAYQGISRKKEWQREQHLLSEAFRGPIRQRGYLCADPDELVQIAKWKWPPGRGQRVERSPDIVEKVTCESFGLAARGQPGLAVHLLRYLRGVETRMATAILTVYDPGVFTVMDRRAWAALGYLKRQPAIKPADPDGKRCLDEPSTYEPYLQACRSIASEHGVDLRTLDRCLWMMGKYKLRTREQINGWLETHMKHRAGEVGGVGFQ